MDKLIETLSFGVDGDENYSLDEGELYRANGVVESRNPRGIPAAQRKDRFTGCLEDFTRHLSADAWCFAQTEPGVVGVHRHTNSFVDTSGKIPKERSFEFRLMFAERPPQFWQTVRPHLLRSRAWLERYEAEAKRRGFDLRFITHDVLYQDAYAYENRLRAHRYLCDCSKVDSRDLEQRLLTLVTPAYQSVESVAKAARADWLDVLVACLKLWLRGALRTDPVTYVGPKWLVRA